MGKAYDIMWEAHNQLLKFALEELNECINYRIQLGEQEYLTPEDDAYYEVELGEDLYLEVDVMDAYSLGYHTEKLKVQAFVRYPDEDEVFIDIENEGEPIALRTLPFDSIVKAVDVLENINIGLSNKVWHDSCL